MASRRPAWGVIGLRRGRRPGRRGSGRRRRRGRPAAHGFGAWDRPAPSAGRRTRPARPWPCGRPGGSDPGSPGRGRRPRASGARPWPRAAAPTARRRRSRPTRSRAGRGRRGVGRRGSPRGLGCRARALAAAANRGAAGSGDTFSSWWSRAAPSRSASMKIATRLQVVGKVVGDVDTAEAGSLVDAVRRGHRDVAVEDQPPVARGPRLGDDRRHEAAADVVAPAIGPDVHALDLGGRGVVALERDRAGRPPVEPGQQEPSGGRRVDPGQRRELVIEPVERGHLAQACGQGQPPRGVLEEDVPGILDVGRRRDLRDLERACVHGSILRRPSHARHARRGTRPWIARIVGPWTTRSRAPPPGAPG